MDRHNIHFFPPCSNTFFFSQDEDNLSVRRCIVCHFNIIDMADFHANPNNTPFNIREEKNICYYVARYLAIPPSSALMVSLCKPPLSNTQCPLACVCLPQDPDPFFPNQTPLQ